MTNDQFDQLMTALNMYVDSGELEYFTGRDWVSWGHRLSGQFRIRPKPREFWINVFHDNSVGAYLTATRATKIAEDPYSRVARTIHVREVVESHDTPEGA